ncbi:GLPGLI family protein [Marinifilum sp.]|uniref:GLPGLI family protein n=1 Tax=Marinifilum sp. TaxID=2033137 RepID=UPI003BAC2EF5
MTHLKQLLIAFSILILVPTVLAAQEKELYIKYKYTQSDKLRLIYSEGSSRRKGTVEVFSYGNKIASRKYKGILNTLDEDGNSIASDTMYYYTVIDYPKGYLLISDDSPAERAQLLLKEPLNLFEWKPGMDTKTILGYTCHKATCNFRGRNYEAWFTRDIPFKAAPWKFHGLPGAILEVYSTDEYCSWVAEGLEIRPFKKEIELPFYGCDIVDMDTYIKILKKKKQVVLKLAERRRYSEEEISMSTRSIEKFDLD